MRMTKEPCRGHVLLRDCFRFMTPIMLHSRDKSHLCPESATRGTRHKPSEESTSPGRSAAHLTLLGASQGKHKCRSSSESEFPGGITVLGGRSRVRTRPEQRRKSDR